MLRQWQHNLRLIWRTVRVLLRRTKNLLRMKTKKIKPRFLAIANFIALALSVVSVLLVFILGKVALNPTHFYIFFMHDLMIALLLMAACAASMTTAFTGKYGNSHVGWMAICDHFAKFCNRGQAVIILTYLGFALYLILTLVSPRNCYISKPLDLIKKGDL